jgi:hypothetical protein
LIFTNQLGFESLRKKIMNLLLVFGWRGMFLKIQGQLQWLVQDHIVTSTG